MRFFKKEKGDGMTFFFENSPSKPLLMRIEIEIVSVVRLIGSWWIVEKGQIGTLLISKQVANF